MSMIRPMPFWPSFEPWEKLTPVHVRRSSARIQNGGGAFPSGAWYRRGSEITAFEIKSRTSAPTNPMSGERNSDFPMLAACAQSTPLVAVREAMSWLAIPTPMIEPMRVWDDEDGRPKNQVPRFQTIAATRRAKTMAKPALLPTWRMSSTGSRETMAKATAPEDVKTPRKFQNPDHTTATWGSREWV